MFNSKGQSSSVFNLLIAAIVSIAILGLLLAIMGGIGFNVGNDPVDTSITLINNAQNPYYAIKNSEITFEKDGSIPKASIADKTDVGPNDIVFGTCENVQNIELEDVRINYTGSSKTKYKLYAVCGSEDIEQYFPEGCSTKEDIQNNFACYLFVGSRN